MRDPIYTGPMLTVDRVDQYLHVGTDEDTVCLQDGFDSICVKLIPGARRTQRPPQGPQGPRGPQGPQGEPGKYKENREYKALTRLSFTFMQESILYNFYHEQQT